MSVAGYSLAEAYVKRKLLKEKLKQTEQVQRASNAAATTTSTDGGECHSRVKQSNGCNLFGVIKKVHPTNGQMVITDSAENSADDE
ncbi:hypothetical protein FNV43_RR10931 [Rhamnella rubrinervis]|uniref:Uncharacterized protein n=1 Tax=Rhamnella rubrinervis TaxID=2594499 RepID=A0A8K0H552_9ROSA|nr:hypothetical protein FNV43_RR10931 [Rhamnella rubrinervis]